MRIPLRRLKKAAKAAGEAFDPSPFLVKGEKVVCPICGGEEFARSFGGMLTKPFLSSLRSPWLELDRDVTTLICTHCAHILHFGRAPERLEEEGE